MTQPARVNIPLACYRVQLQPEFRFDQAAAAVKYFADLGISHLYLSPILAATPGSTHGYDVIDQSTFNSDLGGANGFQALSAELSAHQLSAIADIVPNHMAVPTPENLNQPLWSVLREGPQSPFSSWFDIDWSAGDQAILMPILGQRIGQVLANKELTIGVLAPDDPQPVLRYHDHVFPIRAETLGLPLAELIDRQWYRLAHWRVADEELNYRRFFDVDALAAVRVEKPEVFAATHRLVLELVAKGQLTGLRIDHPDGLADPEGYLEQLAAATNNCWVVVEKILEGSEPLPHSWNCSGTTGYDALTRLGGVFVDPTGAAPLSALLTEVSGESTELETIISLAKREIIAGGQCAEVDRLVDLLANICRGENIQFRDHTRGGIYQCLTELLVAMDCYRAYIRPPEFAPPETVEIIERAAHRAAEFLPEYRLDTLDLIKNLVLGQDPLTQRNLMSDPLIRECVIRFQQTCGPIMAKGVEDTAFYRSVRLIGLNEVGGNPDHFGVSPEEFHDFFGRQQKQWPNTLLTLATHDTKRSEDVRARLAVLSELPGEWADTLREVRTLAAGFRDPLVDPVLEYLLWQTILGTWSELGPMSPARLHPYALKAAREAKVHTRWTAPDEPYEGALLRFISDAIQDREILAALSAFVARTDQPWRANVLGQKLLQLMAPGVPDIYQGAEVVDLTLVDPDNRRPVDFAALSERLERVTSGAQPQDLSDEKLRLVHTALQLRKTFPDCFIGDRAQYHPIPTTTGNAVTFGRGNGPQSQVIAVATRLSVTLAEYGGWREHTLTLPSGIWVEQLTGCSYPGGSVALAELLAQQPVALLTRS